MAVHPPWCGTTAESDAELPAREGCNVFKVDNIVFDVPSHMHFLRALGKGTFGAVAAFRDEKK